MLDFSVIYGFFHTSLKIELDERQRQRERNRQSERERQTEMQTERTL